MPTESRTRVAHALHMVFGQGSRIPDVWDANLSHEDAIFAQALLGLCLRRWGRMQAYIRSKLTTPERGLPLGSQVCLAIGLAQLAWLPGVSVHAAVNEAVDLMGDRTMGFPPHRGLGNAMLRAASKDRAELSMELETLPSRLDRTPFVDKLLVEALAPRNQGRHLEELWAQIQDPPRPAFVVVKPEPMPDGLEPDPELPGSYRLCPGASFPREWLASGAGMVQDRSSQALMSFQWDRPIQRIADLCSAPGGKTTSLGLRWPSAELHSVEQHPRRARRLEENLRIRGIRTNLIVQDAVAWLQETPLTFDLILLDAPCSGSGTLRKHPELTWLGDALDVPHLRKAQLALLEAAIPRLASGGLLIYSVCSWLAEEGAALKDRILDENPRLKLAPIWPSQFQTSDGLFQPDPLAWEGEGFQGFAVTTGD